MKEQFNRFHWVHEKGQTLWRRVGRWTASSARRAPEREQTKALREIWREPAWVHSPHHHPVSIQRHGATQDHAPNTAAAVSIFAQIKIYWCGANITSHSGARWRSARPHSVAGGIIGFMLVFGPASRTMLHEGKKYLGHLDCIRNANTFIPSSVGNDEQGHDAKINADKVKLRGLSTCLRLHSSGGARAARVPRGCPAPSDDAGWSAMTCSVVRPRRL